MIQWASASGYAAATACLAAALACGGDSPNSPSPSPDSGSPGPSGATITIANGSVSPQSVQIAVGQSVTFVNNDSRSRQMTSNPHPTHTDCPPINAVGNIPAGQTRVTNAFTTARTCGFHDHTDPDNPGVRGTIEIR
jgi:plastocyanin